MLDQTPNVRAGFHFPICCSLSRSQIQVVTSYGRYSYRRVTALLRTAGWHVNRKCVECIRRREGLRCRSGSRSAGRSGSRMDRISNYARSIRGTFGPKIPSAAPTHDGHTFRIMVLIDEASRELLALLVQRRIRSRDVLAVLADLFVRHGPSADIR